MVVVKALIENARVSSFAEVGRAALRLVVIVVVGCKPEFDDRTALVEEPRVLAVQSTPAEALPGAQVLLRALYVAPTGTPTSRMW